MLINGVENDDGLSDCDLGNEGFEDRAEASIADAKNSGALDKGRNREESVAFGRKNLAMGTGGENATEDIAEKFSQRE